MQRVVPAVRVASYSESLQFYKKLGFSGQWTHQFEPGFPTFASVICDGMEIFLTEHTGDCAFGGLVHFYVPDVDASHAQFEARGVPIEQPPNNGLGPNIRTMLILDPDGNRLSFITLSD